VPAGQSEEFKIDNIQATYLNVAHQSNRGIDLTIRYQHEFPFGDFSVQGQFTWQLEDIVQLLPELPLDDDNGEIGQPEFTGVVDLRLDSGDWTYFWGINFVGETSDKDIALTQNAAGTRFYKVSTEPTTYHTASVAREFDQWNLRVGVQNIFDEHPPAITSAAFTGGSARFGNSVVGSQYDYRGRTGFITIGRKFN
jgi:iron complex outermembrane receptor protein